MDSIGERLKEARQKKGVSLDHVARDTNISRKYVEAFEEEDFSLFPGETYLIGFLQTYADYLDLDSTEIVNSYKNLKIQEQPVPIEALTKPIKTVSVLPILLVIGVVLVIGGGITLAVLFGGSSQEPKRIDSDDKNTISYSGEVMEKAFKNGDVISMNQKGKSYRLTVNKGDNGWGVVYGKSTLTIAPGKPGLIDIDSDGSFDAKVFFISADQNDSALVTLRFDRNINAVEAVPEAGITSSDTKYALPVSGTPSNSAWVVNPVILKTSATEQAFPVSIVFSDNVYFRYQKDQEERAESMYTRGSTLKFDTVSNNLVIWAANAKNVSMTIDGVDYVPGKAGEIAVRIIHWVKNQSTGQFELRADAVY